jgi:hypothetical protein
MHVHGRRLHTQTAGERDHAGISKSKVDTEADTIDFEKARKSLSERRDLNSGPLAPHASALPDCATFRTVDYTQLACLMFKVLEGLLKGIELGR